MFEATQGPLDVKVPQGLGVMSRYSFVFIDTGRAMPGNTPALLKIRQHTSRRDGIELWQKLLQQGWKRVSPQW